ncbi:hypothetical protein [Lacticaseibacillus paracasei]|uniref:hypothetical protein n=1 Tax=Lacticaseibacillus paracasei TaxID=1597 RepID=UPI0025A15EF9|nr:hypothetical protein [Lacticaseibacillus paracasei]MDM7530290.1 hypothetical protein [Lacticaseibacillus paracasei]MDM7542386.1 hypothetical protein [Lacticaseibacillus paracasei]
MAWVVKGEEAGVTDYYFDKLSGRQKVVIGEFAAMFDDPLYHFKSEDEAEMVARNVYYDEEEMNICEVTDDDD